MALQAHAPTICKFLGDPSVPLEHRRHLLRAAILEADPAAEEVIADLLARLQAEQAETLYEEKCAELANVLRDLEAGPLRSATIVSLFPAESPPSAPHAMILLEDGTSAFTVVPDAALAASLRVGDSVLVDGRGKAVLRAITYPVYIGDEATFERVVREGHVEVTLQERERAVFLVSGGLRARIESGEVSPGDTLVVNIRQRVAFDALPKADSLSHLSYLDRSPVPDIDVERDMGNPPAILGKIRRQIHDEMTRPELRRRFRLARSSMSLLVGRPGTGKTLTVTAMWRLAYEIMSEVTGVPVQDLPPRVFRLKAGLVLSEWFGRSDKNIERFFDEVQQMAGQPWTAPDGTTHTLPVLVVLEEIDGLAKSRGHDAIYDRVLNSLLQRLDPNRADLRENLIVFIGTTNDSTSIDSAMLRRIGSRIETFGKLGRKAFASVLTKRIDDLPVIHEGAPDARAALVSEATAWLFSRNGSDPGLVELTYAGATSADIRYRRDFLTGALVHRAVEEASDRAYDEAIRLGTEPGVRIELLIEELDRQIRATATLLNEHNAHKFLDLPDAVRVASVRRLPQPALFPPQLQSN